MATSSGVVNEMATSRAVLDGRIVHAVGPAGRYTQLTIGFTGRPAGSAGSGELGDEPGGVNGADPGDEVVSGPGPVALDRDGLAALGEADRVAALGDVGEAGRVLLLQAVERRVDEPELLMRVLVGDGDDAGELRRRAAGAAGREPPPGRPGSRTRK